MSHELKLILIIFKVAIPIFETEREFKFLGHIVKNKGLKNLTLVGQDFVSCIVTIVSGGKVHCI